MKRYIGIFLSFAMVVSMFSINAAAVNDVQISKDDVQTEDISGVSSVENLSPVETLDASTLDFSSAINVTDAVLAENNESNGNGEDRSINNIQYIENEENQNPVGEPEIYLLNEDSLKNGQYTNNSEFFIATRWDGVDLCYDPDGDPISIVYNTSFPGGYVTKVEDPQNNAYAGYMIRIIDPGVYPFAFVFVDPDGGATEPIVLQFDIVSRGDFEIIKGSLDTATDTETYQITVDYSLNDEYFLSLLRTGTSKISVNVLDSSGDVCATANCSGPAASQSVQNGINLKKPSGATGNTTYTVQVSTTENGFVENDAGFEIAYGPDNQKYFFFEGVASSVDLPYYHAVRNPSVQVEGDFSANGPLSDIGHYYKINTTGDESITVTSTNNTFRIRILDAASRTVLYDGEDVVPTRYGEFTTDLYFTRLDVSFEDGGSYYVVVYDLSGQNNRSIYNVTVGERKLEHNTLRLEVPERSMVKGNPYEWTINVETPFNSKAYADTFYYSGSSAGWPYEGGYFEIMTPETSSWISNGTVYNREIDFNFDNLGNPLVKADGTWRLRIEAEETGTYPGATIILRYWYEL